MKDVNSCACLHASLICGDETCIYGDEDGELDFWEEIEADDDVLCVLSLDGFEHEFIVNENRYFGMWHRILTMITPSKVIDLQATEERVGISQLTNGNIYVLLRNGTACTVSVCPITNVNEFFYELRDDDFYKENIKADFECDICAICEDEVYGDDKIYIEDEDIYICPSCFSSHFHECYKCGDVIRDEDKMRLGIMILCENCYEKMEKCSKCGLFKEKTHMIHRRKKPICISCYKKRWVRK